VVRLPRATVTEDENFVQIGCLLQGGLEVLEITASLVQTTAFFSCIFDTVYAKL
jgi:hypothetical protein